MGLEVNNHVTSRILPNNWSNTRIDILYNENDKTKMTHAMSSSMKHALKSKILTRRRDQGLGDIPVDFTPRQSYPMTQEEKDKAERKRQSNRMSAKRSRDKQKTQCETNEMILPQLQSKNEQLLNTIKEIEAQKSSMISDLKNRLSENRINEILLEKVDYNSPNIHSENTSGDIMKDIGASGDADEASSDTRGTFCDPDEADVSLPHDLEVSELTGLEEFQLTNDYFVNSGYHTNTGSEENDTNGFGMCVTNALDTVYMNI